MAILLAWCNVCPPCFQPVQELINAPGIEKSHRTTDSRPLVPRSVKVVIQPLEE